MKWKLQNPEGKEYLNADKWTPEMLPKGYRPLYKGERYKNGQGELLLGGSWEVLNHSGEAYGGDEVFIRVPVEVEFDANFLKMRSFLQELFYGNEVSQKRQQQIKKLLKL